MLAAVHSIGRAARKDRQLALNRFTFAAALLLVEHGRRENYVPQQSRSFLWRDLGGR